MHRPVHLWTRPAERGKPCGPCGHAVDNIPVAHRVPTTLTPRAHRVHRHNEVLCACLAERMRDGDYADGHGRHAPVRSLTKPGQADLVKLRDKT